MKTVLTIIGTRPEAIKLTPILIALNKNRYFTSKVCISRQHTDLLDPLLLDLGITINYQLENNLSNKSLHQSAARILGQFETILAEAKPDIVIVQGDTTTAFSAALAAFYSHIPVAHVEAGLRTSNLTSPWPEEAHRCLIDRLTTYFFPPTDQAQNTLIAEGISPKKIWVVGNTSIDAIRLVRKAPTSTRNKKGRIIVVTIHRRENHGEPLKEICHALRTAVTQFPDIKIFFLVHPNPAVRKPITDMLSGVLNIELREPLDHTSFIHLLDTCTFIITDSGGIQEEATFIGKPVLIIRDTTERPECIQTGNAMLVGTKSLDIIACCKKLLESTEVIASMSKVHFPYGDGYAAERIVKILEQETRKISP